MFKFYICLGGIRYYIPFLRWLRVLPLRICLMRFTWIYTPACKPVTCDTPVDALPVYTGSKPESDHIIVSTPFLG